MHGQTLSQEVGEAFSVNMRLRQGRDFRGKELKLKIQFTTLILLLSKILDLYYSHYMGPLFLVHVA